MSNACSGEFVFSLVVFYERKMQFYVVSAAITTLLSYVATESCYYQRCLGCHPEEIVWTGTPKECHPSNWVSAEWVYKFGHPPPTTDSRIPIEYRCLRMIATPDDKSMSNTVDVIRGCVPRAQVDSVCLGLVAVERARGHSDARCSICNRNNCNSSTRVRLQIYVPLLSVILYYVLR